MTQDIRVAFLGAGRMGLTHLKNLTGINGVRVVTIADASLAAAQNAQLICRAERATDDIDAAITAPDIDAVVISTPTATHAHLIETAARAKKAVWCEKPIALTLAETQRVVNTVREMNVPVQLGFMRRFDPGYRAAKAKIDAGELGRIETFRALSRDNTPPPVAYLKSSGGIFLDMAVHDFDLARFLVGEVEQVQAWGGILIDEAHFRAADDIDTAYTLLRFKNGAMGVVDTSRRSAWGYDIRTEIAGFDGKVVVEAAAKTPLQFSSKPGHASDYFESFPDRFADGYRLELEAFFSAIQNGTAPSPGPEDALETLRLALAATLSWRENKPINVQDVK